MLKEVAIISVLGVAAAYVLDPQIQADVNHVIAGIVSPATTTSTQNQQTNNSGSGIGNSAAQQILSDLSQLFSNQQQLQSEISSTSTTPPPVNITYPSPTSNSNNNQNLINSLLAQQAAQAAANQAAAQQAALAAEQASAAQLAASQAAFQAANTTPSAGVGGEVYQSSSPISVSNGFTSTNLYGSYTSPQGNTTSVSGSAPLNTASSYNIALAKVNANAGAGIVTNSQGNVIPESGIPITQNHSASSIIGAPVYILGGKTPPITLKNP